MGVPGALGFRREWLQVRAPGLCCPPLLKALVSVPLRGAGNLPVEGGGGRADPCL